MGRIADLYPWLANSDAIGVGVMLDCARVLIERKQPIFGAAIFLFNGAEGRHFNFLIGSQIGST